MRFIGGQQFMLQCYFHLVSIFIHPLLLIVIFPKRKCWNCRRWEKGKQNRTKRLSRNFHLFLFVFFLIILFYFPSNVLNGNANSWIHWILSVCRRYRHTLSLLHCVSISFVHFRNSKLSVEQYRDWRKTHKLQDSVMKKGHWATHYFRAK